MAWFPMHARAFEAGLDHDYTRTFDHAGPNRPALSLVVWILHQRGAHAQIVQVHLHGLKLSERSRQTITPAQKQTWATMLEDMQTYLKRLGRQGDSPLL